MATKKKAPKRATPKKNTERSLPSEVEKDDLLMIHLAVKNVEIAQLREELSKLRAAQGETLLEQARKQLSLLGEQANEKYGLTPGSDSYDLNTGVIKRGTQE